MTRCPPAFPAGCFWYRNRRSGPGRPPKWIDDFVNTNTKIGSGDQPDEEHDDEDHDDKDRDDEDRDDEDQRQENSNDGRRSDGTGQTRPEPKGSKIEKMVPSRTRTRNVKPPTRYRS